eukprot:350725-Chlamydomonas_euryale.AAC.1
MGTVAVGLGARPRHAVCGGGPAAARGLGAMRRMCSRRRPERTAQQYCADAGGVAAAAATGMCARGGPSRRRLERTAQQHRSHCGDIGGAAYG